MFSSKASPIQVLFCLLLLTVAGGCKAQKPVLSAPGTVDAQGASLDRRIEVLLRSQFSIPTEYDVILGARGPSPFSGYDNLPVTFAHGKKMTSANFLISTDNKTLARLDSYDLVHMPALTIGTAGRPIRGNPAAKVTVVNFDDLECPYCARMHQELFPETIDHYKDKVRFVYKDYPLVEIHPWAMRAAVDANCLATQNGNAYWDFVDYLHSHGQEVNGEDRDTKKSFAALDRIATQQGTISKLDSAQLAACLQKQDETAIHTSMKEGDALGVDSTPSIFINGEHLIGAVPREQVWQAIDRALRSAGVDPPPPETPTPASGPPSQAVPKLSQ